MRLGVRDTRQRRRSRGHFVRDINSFRRQILRARIGFGQIILPIKRRKRSSIKKVGKTGIRGYNTTFRGLIDIWVAWTPENCIGIASYNWITKLNAGGFKVKSFVTDKS